MRLRRLGSPRGLAGDGDLSLSLWDDRHHRPRATIFAATELLFLEDAGGDPCSRSTAARKAPLRVGSSIRARCVLRMAFLLGSSNAMIALQTSVLTEKLPAFISPRSQTPPI